MKNPIVRNIALWFVETFAASFLEALLLVLINIWNQFIAVSDLRFRPFNVECLYETFQNKDVSVSCEPKDFEDSTTWGDLIVFDEIENAEPENINYPMKEACGDIVISDPMEEFADFQIRHISTPLIENEPTEDRSVYEHIPTSNQEEKLVDFQLQHTLTPYSLIESQAAEDGRVYEQLLAFDPVEEFADFQLHHPLTLYTLTENNPIEDGTSYEHIPISNLEEESADFQLQHASITYNLIESEDHDLFVCSGNESVQVGFDDGTHSNYPSSMVERNRGICNLNANSGNEVISDFEFFSNYGNTDDFFEPLNYYCQPTEMLTEVSNTEEVPVEKDFSPLSEWERGNETQRSDFYYENFPVEFHEPDINSFNAVNKELFASDTNNTPEEEEGVEFRETDVQEMELFPRSLDRVKYSLTVQNTDAKTLEDKFIHSLMPDKRQKSRKKGDKKVLFSKSIETFTYEPDLSIKENFYPDGKFPTEELVKNGFQGTDHRENYPSQENVDFIWPTANISVDELQATRDFMEKWMTEDEVFHQMTSDDSNECKMRFYEKMEVEDIIDVPQEKFKSWPGVEIKSPRKKRNLKRILPYHKSGEYCRDLTLSLQNLKLDPKSLMKKFKKQVLKK